MKKIILLLLCISFSSCILGIFGALGGNEDDNYEYGSNYNAEIIKRTDLDASIVFQDDIEMTESSKIYIIGDYIFINDKRKGFHIFDNSDAFNPVKVKFLKVPGATDISIRDNVFFINQATDLVSLTIDINTFSLTINKRLENVFPKLLSPDGFNTDVDEYESVIVNWTEK